MSRPLPRYLHTTSIDAAKVDRIISQTQGTTLTNPMHLANPAELRGIPCIARGVGGTQPGSNPLSETIARDSKKRRYNR